MVNIKIDDKYRIISDTHNYTLEAKANPELAPKSKFKAHKKSVVSNPSFRKIAYCSHLKHTLKCYLEVSLKESTATSWEELMKDQQKIKENIDKILNKFEQVI